MDEGATWDELEAALEHRPAAKMAADTWETIAPLPSPRYGLAAALGSDGRIYAIGGCRNTPPHVALRTVEAYNPGSNTWAGVAPLLTPRCDLEAVSGADGRI